MDRSGFERHRSDRELLTQLFGWLWGGVLANRRYRRSNLYRRGYLSRYNRSGQSNTECQLSKGGPLLGLGNEAGCPISRVLLREVGLLTFWCCLPYWCLAGSNSDPIRRRLCPGDPHFSQRTREMGHPSSISSRGGVPFLGRRSWKCSSVTDSNPACELVFLSCHGD